MGLDREDFTNANVECRNVVFGCGCGFGRWFIVGVVGVVGVGFLASFAAFFAAFFSAAFFFFSSSAASAADGGDDASDDDFGPVGVSLVVDRCVGTDGNEGVFGMDESIGA